MRRRTVRTIAGKGAALAAPALVSLALGASLARAGDLPPVPDPLDPVALGRVTARILTGRVTAAHPLPSGDVCPTAIADATDARSDERIVGPVALPWDPDRPPIDGWDGTLPFPEHPVYATVLLDARARLVAAVRGGDTGRTWSRSLSVAGTSSSRFSAAELSWAAFAAQRIGSRHLLPERIRHSEGETRDRWLELAVRIGPSQDLRELLAADDVPTDILLLALAWEPEVPGIALRLAERGALPARGALPTDPRFPTRAALLRAGDPEELATLLRGADLPRMSGQVAQSIAAAGRVESPELRRVVEGILRRGEPYAAPALVALGATAEEVLEIAPGATGTLQPDQWPRGRPAESAKLVARSLRSLNPRIPDAAQRAVAALVDLAMRLPPGPRADLLAALPAAEDLPAEIGDHLLLVAAVAAVRARFGDAEAFLRLSAPAGSGGTLARWDLPTVLRLLRDVPGPDATSVLVDVLAPPPHTWVRGGQASRSERRPPNGGEDDALAELASRSHGDRAFALTRIDARFPPSEDGTDGHRAVRWALGRAPTAAALRSSSHGPHPVVFAPRGAWGRDEDALRAELLARRDWRTCLTLDGAIPPMLVRDAIEAIDVDPRSGNSKSGDRFDALGLVTAARSPEAVATLRSILGRGGRRDSFEVVRALALSEAKTDLGAWATDLVTAVQVDGATEPRPSTHAWGFLVALVEGRR